MGVGLLHQTLQLLKSSSFLHVTLLLFQSHTSCFSGVLCPPQNHKRRILFVITDQFCLCTPHHHGFWNCQTCGAPLLDWSFWTMTKTVVFTKGGCWAKEHWTKQSPKTLRVEQVLSHSKSPRTVFVSYICPTFWISFDILEDLITWGFNNFSCPSRNQTLVMQNSRVLNCLKITLWL